MFSQKFVRWYTESDEKIIFNNVQVRRAALPKHLPYSLLLSRVFSCVTFGIVNKEIAKLKPREFYTGEKPWQEIGITK